MLIEALNQVRNAKEAVLEKAINEAKKRIENGSDNYYVTIESVIKKGLEFHCVPLRQ